MSPDDLRASTRVLTTAMGAGMIDQVSDRGSDGPDAPHSDRTGAGCVY
jgi:hypothetical protein